MQNVIKPPSYTRIQAEGPDKIRRTKMVPIKQKQVFNINVGAKEFELSSGQPTQSSK